MTELTILKREDNRYTLLSKDNRQTTITLLCDNLTLSPKCKIFMHNELLDENYVEFSPHYYFGDINEVCLKVPKTLML